MPSLSNLITLGFTLFLVAACSPVSDASANISSNDYKGSAFITQGPAKTIVQNLFTCGNGYSRIAGIGEINDSEGNTWTVPADNHFESATKATDLYEECTNITPKSLSDVDLHSVPVVEIDPDGEEIIGYIFADNYFELFINGTLVGVDSVPFTPFNSSIVKFKVKKPYTIAVKVIDWEENLGLGSESNRGSDYHPGDGGFIASFSDGTVTNEMWQAQTYYTSPVYDLSCLYEVDNVRMSDACSIEGSSNGMNAYAAHWSIPKNWMMPSFDSSNWPFATLYSERDIGVNNKNAYMNFIEKFSGAGASFIWSTNVVLDNEVLLRYTVD